MSTDDTNDKPTSVAAVVAARREAREAEARRQADAQERADKRRPVYGQGTT